MDQNSNCLFTFIAEELKKKPVMILLGPENVLYKCISLHLNDGIPDEYTFFCPKQLLLFFENFSIIIIIIIKDICVCLAGFKWVGLY